LISSIKGRSNLVDFSTEINRLHSILMGGLLLC
jgi:hypothetical protein